MPSFAENYQHKSLLEISRRHRESVDGTRVCNGKVIGQDNQENLAVSTVFAAIAIEASLNDFVLSHCLFVELPYLQEVFSDFAEKYLRGSVQNKIDMLIKRWPDPFPKELVSSVKELFQIRNRITHQTGKFQTSNETEIRRGQMTNMQLTSTEMTHMLRHSDIAFDFLSRFWLPGNREVLQGSIASEQTNSSAT